MVGCEFEGESFDCGQYVESIIDKDHGVCYLISVGLPQTSGGIGLRVLLDLHKGIWDETEVPHVFEGAHLRLGMDINPVLPISSMVAPGSYVKMNLDLQHEKLINAEHSSTPQECLEGPYNYRVLQGPYSDTFCRADCVQEAVFQNCRCFLLMDPRYIKTDFYPGRFCDNSEIENCASGIRDRFGAMIGNCARGCFMSCESWNVGVSQSSMNLGSSELLGFYNENFDSFRENNGRTRSSEKGLMDDSIPPDFPGRSSASSETAFGSNVTESRQPNSSRRLNRSRNRQRRAANPAPDLQDSVSATGRNPRKKVQDLQSRNPILNNPAYWRESVILLDIAYSRMQINSVVQSPSKSINDLFADIGGISGLWLGLNVFGFIQLIVLLIGCVLSKYRK